MTTTITPSMATTIEITPSMATTIEITPSAKTTITITPALPDSSLKITIHRGGEIKIKAAEGQTPSSSSQGQTPSSSSEGQTPSSSSQGPPPTFSSTSESEPDGETKRQRTGSPDADDGSKRKRAKHYRSAIEVKAEETSPDDEFLNVEVQGPDHDRYGQVCQFKIKKNTPIKELMSAWAKQYCEQDLRFRYNGHPLFKDETPMTLGMEENDVIDVFHAQYGGS